MAKNLNIVLSLTTNDNSYQLEQISSAQETARRLGVNVRIIHAENDAGRQSQQLTSFIQGSMAVRPDAIIFEPVGTTLELPARVAVAAGIGWIVLNRESPYLAQLRSHYSVPIFSISTDHEEVGRIQGAQMGALLPKGGKVLHIQGPSHSHAARWRTIGMRKTKPIGIEVLSLKGQWTESSAHRAVSSWLSVNNARDLGIGMVAAQDDAMALGAQRAFDEIRRSKPDCPLKPWAFIGCDGGAKTGQTWVRQGLLAATVIIPPNAGLAIEMLVGALRSGAQPQEQTFTTPVSHPALSSLKPSN